MPEIMTAFPIHLFAENAMDVRILPPSKGFIGSKLNKFMTEQNWDIFRNIGLPVARNMPRDIKLNIRPCSGPQADIMADSNLDSLPTMFATPPTNGIIYIPLHDAPKCLAARACPHS